MGLGRLELPTSRLSGVRSNHLSYKPLSLQLNGLSPVSSIFKRIRRQRIFVFLSLKGGDPAAGSPTATLLRLHPSRLSHLRQLPPCGWVTDFGCYKLPWCDGRCVQGPGTYSPRHADPRLLATPTSCGRVAAHNPNWDHFFEFRSTLRFRFSLSWPL